MRDKKGEKEEEKSYGYGAQFRRVLFKWVSSSNSRREGRKAGDVASRKYSSCLGVDLCY